MKLAIKPIKNKLDTFRCEIVNLFFVGLIHTHTHKYKYIYIGRTYAPVPRVASTVIIKYSFFLRLCCCCLFTDSACSSCHAK